MHVGDRRRDKALDQCAIDRLVRSRLNDVVVPYAERLGHVAEKGELVAKIRYRNDLDHPP